MYFYDTNILLELQQNAFNDFFYISSETLKELENIKVSSQKCEEIKYKARKILHLLDDNQDKYKVVIYTTAMEKIINEKQVEVTPDTKIIACCVFSQGLLPQGEDFTFVTNDISCKMIASRIFGLKVESVSDNNLDEYKGFVEKSLSEEEMAYFYEHISENIYELLTNEYIILKNEDGKIVDTLKWTGDGYDTIRCKPFKSNMFGTLKPLDEIQSCAMDSINTNDITVLYGRAGSGKTTLPLNYIMQVLEKGKYKKFYIIYSYETLKGAKTLGYEKGDHVQKLLYSASIGNILASKFGDITQVEYLIERGTLDIIPTANIRGVEFESDSIVLCTESQNLDVYTLKTILQRCKEGCKQIYEGDIIEQKDTNIQDIGIKRLIDVFKGNKSFGCIKLKNNYRSPLSELADLM